MGWWWIGKRADMWVGRWGDGWVARWVHGGLYVGRLVGDQYSFEGWWMGWWCREQLYRWSDAWKLGRERMRKGSLVGDVFLFVVVDCSHASYTVVVYF